MTQTTTDGTGTQVPSHEMTLAEIESAALKLTDEEKSELVMLLGGEMKSSPETETCEDELRWQAEIQRRVDDIRQGRVKGRDGDTVMREALAKFS